MSKEQTDDLIKFLKPFPADIQKTALWLREFVWDLYPKTNELIYDNYNAVAFGWSPTDKVGHTFAMSQLAEVATMFTLVFTGVLKFLTLTKFYLDKAISIDTFL